MPYLKVALLVLACLFAIPVWAQDAILTFDQPQTAGISGFRAHWNLPIPLSEDGATQFVDQSSRTEARPRYGPQIAAALGRG